MKPEGIVDLQSANSINDIHDLIFEVKIDILLPVNQRPDRDSNPG